MKPAQNVDIVIFDCDSTLTAVEGIDELARRTGLYTELAPLTRAAMEGRVPLEEIYRQRLDLIKPSQADVHWLGLRYLEAVVDGAYILVEALQQAGKQVHIVSGGLRPAVLAVARQLQVPASHVHAVDIQFTPAGAYAGFDESSPLTRSGGKKVVCGKIVGPGSTAVIIGDGLTDWEAAQERVRFIGFGGVARRENVVSRAQEYIAGPSLRPLLEMLVTR